MIESFTQKSGQHSHQLHKYNFLCYHTTYNCVFITLCNTAHHNMKAEEYYKLILVEAVPPNIARLNNHTSLTKRNIKLFTQNVLNYKVKVLVTPTGQDPRPFVHLHY